MPSQHAGKGIKYTSRLFRNPQAEQHENPNQISQFEKTASKAGILFVVFVIAVSPLNLNATTIYEQTFATSEVTSLSEFGWSAYQNNGIDLSSDEGATISRADAGLSK